MPWPTACRVIFSHSECITLGYLDDPTGTRAVIDDEGWLHTGDIGVLGEDGYLLVSTARRTCSLSAGSTLIPPRSSGFS
jgi:acyl-CoA synthetase (AMP-forming)/AMP-acid ligase II